MAYPVGEVTTANGSTTLSALVGPNVYLPETGKTIEAAWFRITTSAEEGVPPEFSVSTKVGSNSQTGVRSYILTGDSEATSSAGAPIIHLIPSADYAHLAQATHSTPRSVQMQSQWIGYAGGAVSAELLITYTYTGTSNGIVNSLQLFAGQQTSAANTTYSTATGAIDPPLPAVYGGNTIRGAYLVTSSFGRPSGGGAYSSVVTLGSHLSTGTCSATATSSINADPTNLLRAGFVKTVTGVTANDGQTYTACYRSGTNQIFGGTLTITYQSPV